MTFDEIITRLRRMWRIYVSPPKETKIFFDPRNVPVISKKISSIQTAIEPKQVVVDDDRKRAYVTCMKGHILQEFSYEDNNLTLLQQWKFPEQCVEAEFISSLIYITTTNFKRGDEQRSHLWIFDSFVGQIISSVDTLGEWSKVIVVDSLRKLVFVSNWHSNDVSVIDISDLKDLKFVQKVSCDKAPRGLVLRPDGVVLATSFYGRKIFAIGRIGQRYEIIKESEPFDPTGYGGNMRDILITRDGKTVWVSNLGRNMVHWYDAKTLELGGSISIPREPNSMRFMTINEHIIGVSCRKDGVICFIDTETKKPIGVSERTKKLPTGLAAIEGGFIVTNFDDNSMELHKVRYN